MIDIDSFNNKNQKAGLVSSENIREYFDELSNHDWYYDYSDDHSVWKRGSANRDRLMNTAAKDSHYKKMYSEFSKWTQQKRERPTIEEFINEV